MSATNTPLLCMKGTSKVFPNGTVALRSVDIDIEAGRVHGLLGANGAGKSTLIRILCGAFRASGGTIEWKGAPVELAGPRSASKLGIATIHQHIPLVPALSVLENIFVSDDGFWRLSRNYRERYCELSERLDYRLDPDVLIADLSIGQRQMVAMMSALMSGAELIVMDEPTASLASEERDLVYRTVRQLSRQENKAVLFVSHFLDEVVDLTDCVTILRDGICVMRSETRDLNEARIAEAIVGREIIAMERSAHKRTSAASSPLLLELRDLASPGKIEPISLSLAKGEVLGIAGLLGSGRSELLHAIFGADLDATGEVLLEGRVLQRSPGAAVKAGIALVGEDRTAQSLFLNFEIWQNLTLPSLKSLSRFGFLPVRSQELDRASSAIRRFGIKAESSEALVTELSGGNAQKVTIGRWLLGDLKLFLLDEPTAGIDIGAKTEILKLLRELADEGMTVIVVSSEFEELLTICDRIIVLRDGSLTANLSAAETSEQDLLLLAGGGGAAQGRGGAGAQSNHGEAL